MVVTKCIGEFSEIEKHEMVANDLSEIRLRVFGEFIWIDLVDEDVLVGYQENSIFIGLIDDSVENIDQIFTLVIDQYLARISKVWEGIRIIKQDHIESMRSHRTNRIDQYVRYASESSRILQDVYDIENEVIAKNEIFNKMATKLSNSSRIGIKLAQIRKHIKNIKRSIDTFRQTFIGYLDVKYTLKTDKLNDSIGYITFITFLFLPIQAISGLFGMNVRVPFEGEDSLKYFILLTLITPLFYLVLYLYKRNIKARYQ
ncbi:MNR2 [Enterospora canceri]|uniref:MNR2 n=1 Tax=Enterospora canceri TaxID=1081671 RepID=A0A1Y1S8K7_9MICR|nr:MNR2 [Enterospora canceri]